MTPAKAAPPVLPAWPDDMSLDAYRSVLPLDIDSVYAKFYEANRATIKVQNPRLAVPRLQQILESTFRISGRRGFHAMSLRDLCQDTGLSMGGVYNYISSKEELARMVTEFVGVTFREANSDLLAAADVMGRQLEARLRAQIYMAELFRPWYFFVYMETKNQTTEQIQRSLDVERNTLDEMLAVIDIGVGSGTYQVAESRLAAVALLSMVQDWFLKPWHFRAMGLGATEYADFVVDAAERLLGYHP